MVFFRNRVFKFCKNRKLSVNLNGFFFFQESLNVKGNVKSTDETRYNESLVRTAGRRVSVCRLAIANATERTSVITRSVLYRGSSCYLCSNYRLL